MRTMMGEVVCVTIDGDVTARGSPATYTLVLITCFAVYI